MIDVMTETNHQAIETLYFAYRAFTQKPDLMLEKRGLNRVHHRILYFVGRQPDQTINQLLKTLQVSKQALNAPLRQLVEMQLVEVKASPADRRVRLLCLTPKGTELENSLTATQLEQLQAAFAQAGDQARTGWFAVMKFLV
jgi:DNA-binding MarR family transcriptional regulator